jgi:hypothetical protein
MCEPILFLLERASKLTARMIFVKLLFKRRQFLINRPSWENVEGRRKYESLMSAKKALKLLYVMNINCTFQLSTNRAGDSIFMEIKIKRF